MHLYFIHNTMQMWFVKHYIRNTTTLQQLLQQPNCSRNRHNIRQAVWYGTFFCSHQEMDPRCEWRQVDEGPYLIVFFNCQLLSRFRYFCSLPLVLTSLRLSRLSL